MNVPTTGSAVEVVTDGPAADNIAHRRWAPPTESKYSTPPTSQHPACLGKPGPDADLSAWRSYGLARAVELGADLCTEDACFGGAA